MSEVDRNLASLDLGNSTCRMGFYDRGDIREEVSETTESFIDNPEKLINKLSTLPRSIAYCSVSPSAENALIKWNKRCQTELFNLNIHSCGDFPITYPETSEIGQDRIANSYAVHKTCQLPAIVIDVGTATTFDVVSEKDGYEGGVIAPGPQGFLDFLHQNTALLPKVSILTQPPSSPIGKKTSEAMLIGTHLGFAPMVMGILSQLVETIRQREKKVPSVILAGGAAHHLELPICSHRPFLTLEGVALAFLEKNVTR